MVEKIPRATSREVKLLAYPGKPMSLSCCITIAGMFAGEVGVIRLLKLFEKYNMKTTWFVS
jgi:peptidoglycan/xylan/chitin deacetylase (PgdA/CDA1 family)